MTTDDLIERAERFLVRCGIPSECTCPPGDPRAVIADLVAKLRAANAVLADRERELLELKRPCSGGQVGVGPCRLHYAHSGPCDILRGHPPAAYRTEERP